MSNSASWVGEPLYQSTGDTDFIFEYEDLSIFEVEELIAANGVHTAQYTLLPIDRTLAVDTQKTFWTQTVSIQDTVRSLILHRPAFAINLINAVQAEDDAVLKYALKLFEQTTIQENSELRVGTHTVDTLQSNGSFAVAINDILQELLSAGGNWSAVDVLRLRDTVAAYTPYGTTITSSLLLALLAQDFAAAADTEFTTEELLADQAFQLEVTKVMALYDELEVAVSTSQTLTIMVSDTLEGQAGDSVEVLGQYLAEPLDVLAARVIFRLGEESITGWVMNTEGDMPLSEYVGYDFNSFCKVGGVYLGARDEGLYLLDGDTDDGTPIDAAVRTMMLDFGSPVMKRVRNAYIGYTSQGKLLLKVGTTDGGQLKEQWYEAKELQAQAPREQMIRLGRGLRSRYWQFELVNVDGSDFELMNLELHPVYLNRRV